MKIGIFLRNRKLDNDPRYIGLMNDFSSAGCHVVEVSATEDITPDTDMLVSVGGDGTFLTSAMLVGDRMIPILGVNLGRLGFLSENRPENVVHAVMSGSYQIEERALLKVIPTGDCDCFSDSLYPFALNEIAIHRSGPAMLGVDVSIDGNPLPTYWADGLVVATASGSTAYSLSVGGPIVLPESKVLIVSPIAPHNLNVRPLVVPDTSVIELSLRSRDLNARLSVDNRCEDVCRDIKLRVSLAQFSLRRVRLNNSNFINALTSKLFWGEDIRNGLNL